MCENIEFSERVMCTAAARGERSSKLLAHMIDRSYAVIKSDLAAVDVNSLTAQSSWVQHTRDRVREVFGVNVRPCLWQVKVALATLKGDKHVLSISRTGSGKTLTFWIPALLCNDGIIIVVVPLNILGQQNVDQLSRAGIKSVVITGESDTDSNYEVCELQTLHLKILIDPT